MQSIILYYVHKPNYNKDMILVSHFSASPPISLMQNIYSAIYSLYVM